MLLTPVNSSAIRAVGYDRQTGTLAVQFHSRSTIYTHPRVPFEVFLDFMNATSIGGYYARHIRWSYR